jgi:tetratricopeptide (TPR) repeat protein
VAKEAQELRRKSIESDSGDGEEQQQQPISAASDGQEEDVDSDRDFADTLAFGARFLCRHLGRAERAVELADLAAQTLGELERDALGEDRRLWARVERFRGISRVELAWQEADPETRPDHQAKAVEHLQRAASLDPTCFDNLYHLAFVQAELRDSESALASVRKAIVLSSSRKEAWHLLVLLTTAEKDWESALKQADAALEDDPEPRFPEDDDVVTPADERNSDDTLSSPIAAAVKPSSGPSSSSPGAATTQGSQDLADEIDLLEADVQLRMTRNVIVEAMEGPEAALQDQQALFQFFSHATSQLKSADSESPPNL